MGVILTNWEPILQVVEGKRYHTVDGINPAPVEVGSLSVYPIIYRVSYMSGGARFLPSTVVSLFINQFHVMVVMMPG